MKEQKLKGLFAELPQLVPSHRQALLMFEMRPESKIEFGPADGPWLTIVVDAEEEFDWTTFSTSAQSVKSIAHQHLAQEILVRHGAVPTYFVDYPVANQAHGVGPLKEFLDDGLCSIGAHVHPWVNPPVEENVCLENSFPGNLPKGLEKEKLRRLTGLIADRFEMRPSAYRAGRYGAGPNTASVLEELDYEIDMSVLPHTDLFREGGPDFSSYGPEPFWFGSKRELLELPLTAANFGLLSKHAGNIYRQIDTTIFDKLMMSGMLVKLGLLERVRLTPEGTKVSDAVRLTRAMYNRGLRSFVLTYHSSSLLPGHTPHVKTKSDLDRLLEWLDEYLTFFRHEMNGAVVTPDFIRKRAIESRTSKQPTSITASRKSNTKRKISSGTWDVTTDTDIR